MTAPSNFAYSFIPVGIQTVGDTPLIGVVVDLPFDGTVETVADIASAEVADARIEVGGSVQLEETGWGLYALDPTAATLTAPCQGIWLATIGDTGDSDSMLVAYSPCVQTSGVVDPSWDSGVAFLPFEARGVGVESIVAGANVTVNDSDPAHPIVSASGGGGGSLPAGGDLGETVINTGDGTGDWGSVDSDHVVILDAPGGDPLATLTEVDLPSFFGRIVSLEDWRTLLTWLPPVRVVSTTFGDTLLAGDVIDGKTLAAGDRVLCTAVGGTGNQIVVVQASGSPSPAPELTGGYRSGTAVRVAEGTVHGGSEWYISTPDPFDVGSDTITWTEVTAGGGSGPDLSDADPLAPGTVDSGTSPDASRADHVHPRQTAIVNSEIDPAAAIAESKLNLASDAAAGTASRRTLGTGSTQAAAGNDSRFTDARTPSTGGSNDDIMQRKSGAWTNRTPAQVKTDLVLVKGDVGLGNVTNDAQVKLAWAPLTIVKGADQVYLSTATLVNDTVLTQAIGVSETWTFRAILYAYGATAADLSVGVNLPSGATVRAMVLGPASTYAGSAASYQTQGVITASTAVGAAGFGTWGTGTTAAAAAAIVIEGTVINSTNAGAITIQHCQGASTASNTTVEAFSTLTCRRTA